MKSSERYYMHSSFGWDLAAYGESSYSALCEGKLDESRFTATMLRCNAISNPKLVMTLNLSETVANERRVLVACCAKAEFFVDIPIDLRPLLDVVNFSSKFTANNYWQLVRRPIDQALGGLTPLADFIGYPVARIANLLRGFKDPGPVELNRTLFETYPAANLELIRCNNERVQRVYDKYRWVSGLKAKEPKNWPAWLQAALKDHLGDSLELTKNEREKLVALVLRHWAWKSKTLSRLPRTAGYKARRSREATSRLTKEVWPGFGSLAGSPRKRPGRINVWRNY